MFSKVLVANRGEIAIRIIRACRELGIASVAIYSDVDEEAIHVRLADEARPLGGIWPQETYLAIDKIIAAAKDSGAEAIHPGYGFLSENPTLAAACSEAGLVFIGPSPDAMRSLGNKLQARQLATSLGLPTAPGYLLEPDGDLRATAKILRYPIMIKAAAGGGGRGMQVVMKPEELAETVTSSRRIVKAAFGDDTLFAEHIVAKARHIEVQVLADAYSNILALGERECSIQRNYQKIMEESPAPGLTDNLRWAITRAAMALTAASGYQGVGTAEFLIDSFDNFYFIEMNTRLQVEHPVTEMVSGYDIVQAQIRLAAGEPLPMRGEWPHQRGAAIECRIYAEDPYNRWAPSVGTITEFYPPNGENIRFDSALYQGMRVTEHYDALLAKLIAWGEGRPQAIARLRRALGEIRITGVKTTIPLHRQIVDDPAFLIGDLDTGFIERRRLVPLSLASQFTKPSPTLDTLEPIPRQPSVTSRTTARSNPISNWKRAIRE